MFEFIKKYIPSPESSQESIKPRRNDPLKVGREVIVKTLNYKTPQANFSTGKQNNLKLS